ncbi:xanthine dehydrogenase accessory protein XdhC [Rhodoferax sp.]|uniref:xanthine dehydrogenase accessory protein XdhC n=1 Tax=Rhodoferax sp. TaxID=50421 RepID=UPI0028507D71|nr:xanthine dehydrogenase accessory protein XdhC [Rhodoferax sp.]MDR3367784.1 xanthine dehydrogenase accessory protein XdhC [Rhodoferax sp.]
MTKFDQFLQDLATQDAVLVTVQSHRGSVPREAGAWMAVFADHVLGTVGGGHIEWQAQQEARQMLEAAGPAQLRRYPLGPALGQCCGGEVHLRYECVSTSDLPVLHQRQIEQMASWPVVALFGGGHVGRALMALLQTLPLRLQWVDSREEIFPFDVFDRVLCEHSQPVHAAVTSLPPGAHVLIMSFSHAEDLDVVMACLQRQRTRADVPFIGLIGSRSKWATFSHRLAARGFSEAELAQVTCPIGIAGIAGKEPEVIAVAVAAQLLQVTQQVTHRVASAHND